MPSGSIPPGSGRLRARPVCCDQFGKANTVSEPPSSVYWFSSLIANGAHLAPLKQQLQKAGAQQVQSVAMAQGQKQSRFLAWTFLDAGQRAAWRQQRWTGAGEQT